jgi:Fe-S cluster assembly scaffold protein SufB
MRPDISIEGGARLLSFKEALAVPSLAATLKQAPTGKEPKGYLSQLGAMEHGDVIVVEPSAKASISISRTHSPSPSFGTFFIFGENSHSAVFYKTSLQENSHEARGLFLGKGSVAHCCFLQADGEKAESQVSMVASLGENSQLKLLNSNLGSAKKTDRFLILQNGRGSRCEHFEVSLAKGHQKFIKESDHLHIAPDTYSRSIFKYATAGHSQVNVDGKVTIEQSAPGSDTHLLAKSLLLSEHSISKVIPMLFVANSNVLAGHGSAMTPLQDEELFYLRSRGIGESESKLLVLQGFLQDILAKSEMDASALAPLEAELEKDAFSIFPRD